jgi:hypothetical protein
MSAPMVNGGTPLTQPPTCAGVDTSHTYATMRLLAPNRIAWEGPDTPTDDRMGNFTMVYDEGWEATFPASQPDDKGLPAIRLWGFLDWEQINSTTVASYCGSVTTGTFHDVPKPNEAPTAWGCYTAKKKKPPAPRLHAFPSLPSWAKAGAGYYQPLPAQQLHHEMPRAVQDDRPDSSKYAGLPESLDWDLEGKVELMRDQLTCGSCYAFASTSMLASRGRIAGVDNLYLSPQDMISCGSARAKPGMTHYAQGCDGGFGYLVAKWAQDFTIATNPCFPYESGLSDSFGPTCSKRCTDAPGYRATNIHYVGGYFGNCSEVSAACLSTDHICTQDSFTTSILNALDGSA